MGLGSGLGLWLSGVHLDRHVLVDALARAERLLVPHTRVQAHLVRVRVRVRVGVRVRVRARVRVRVRVRDRVRV